MKNKLTGSKLWGLVVVYVGYMLLFADRTAFNLTLALIGKDFNMQAAALGTAASAFFLGYTVMQIPGGYLTDRFGTRALVITSLVGWSLLTGLTGVAWSLGALILIRFLFGVAEGPYPAAALKQVALDYDDEQRANISTLLISSNYAGAALAPVVLVPVIAGAGWRATFFILAVFGLVLCGLYMLATPKATVKEDTSSKIDWSVLDWKIALFVVIGLLLNIITKGMETWMPYYFLTTQHLNLANLAWLVPLPTIAGGIAAAIAGWVMVHWFSGKERLFLVIATGLTAVFMFGLFKAPNLPTLVTFQVLTYFAKSLAFTGIFGYCARVLAKKVYGSVIGVVNFGGQLGGFLGPLVIGWMLQLSNNSYSVAFLGLLACAIGALVFAAFVGNVQVVAGKKA